MSYQIESLSHHGIKGMKWGIRRFQNRDGTLTLLGKKRNRLNDKNDKETEKEPPKSTRSLSDSELRSRIERLSLERQALSLEKEVARLDPKSVSKGESFFKKLSNEVLAPAVINAGREQLTKLLNKTLSKALGFDVNTEDITNSFDLLKKPLSELTDGEIRKLSKRYENISTIKKGRNDEQTVDESTGAKEKSRQDHESVIKKGIDSDKTDKPSGSNSKQKTTSESSSKTSAESKSDLNTGEDLNPRKWNVKEEKSSGFKTSNSNAQSIHNVYTKYYDTGRTTVNDLSRSGYKMTSLEKIESGKNISNAKSFISSIGDYKMPSVEELEKR